jgi:hypothetical protein
VSAIPPASPASPAPAAIAGVLSFFAVAPIASPALCAPLLVASFALAAVFCSFDELDDLFAERDELDLRRALAERGRALD